MDSWPVDYRTQRTSNSASKASAKTKQHSNIRTYPDIDHGPNTITLIERDGWLEWTSLIKNRTEEDINHLQLRDEKSIFPPTRLPPQTLGKATPLQSAEQGANFLRTYLPDVDIPAELIRDELSQDARSRQKLERFDPFLGNVLEPVLSYDSAFLAFSMGELNCDLNLSPFIQSDRGLVFKPSMQPVRTFNTPIQQIKVSNPRLTSGLRNSRIAIRTFGCTSLFEVDTSKNWPRLCEVVTIQHSDTGGRAPVDISLSTTPTQALVVNDIGSVYSCTVSSGNKYINHVHTPVYNAYDNFWRLARGILDTSYIIASKTSLTQGDLRNNDCLRLFTLQEQKDVLTCVEDQHQENTIKICSTREIFWIDTRYPGKPLLGYRHGRQNDRYLEIQSSPLSPDMTVLTSRNNALVTLYDASLSSGRLLHIRTPPYCYIPGKDISATYIGQTLFKHPFDTASASFSLIRLTDHGGLRQADFYPSGIIPTPVFETVWTSAVQELANEPLQARGTLYDSQTFTETDLSAAYDHVFRVHEQERKKKQEEDAIVVYDLLERLPAFWHEVEAPVEQMLTTYDVVFRAGIEPLQSSRADFLTESIINSTRGYRALVQNRLSPDTLVKDAGWHANITPILQRFDSRFPNHVHTNDFYLYDLLGDPERSPQSLGYEKEAREQLALDLALSSEIFSSQAFSQPSDESRELEAMTKTLSLGGEPLPLEFGYLYPKPSDHYREGGEEEAITSMGVRSLLKDWEISADPGDYVFKDHYGGIAATIQPIRRVKISETASQVPNAQSQGPPTILAASSLPVRLSEDERRVGVAQSQGAALPPHLVRFRSQISTSSILQPSQEYTMSTQILPGVHGGRPPTTVKKKLAHKRVGGF